MANKVERNVKRTHVWGRVFLSGASGSGKTRGAFELASRLYDGALPIVLANTEPNRGKLYADRFPIEALIDIEGDYHPDRFIEAIDDAEQIAPGGILILDSATHEWYGTNGITQQASRFGDWAKARPLHQKFVDRLQLAQMHVIVCCRAKMKYEQVDVDDGRGGTKPAVVTLGVGPMQDADFQYEFSLAGQIDRASHLVEWSGHIDSLEGTTSNLVEDADAIASTLTGWLSAGEPVVPPEEAADEDVTALLELWAELRPSDWETISETTLEKARRLNRGALHPDWVAEQTEKAKANVATKRKTSVAAEPKAE
jgi:AAA domain